MPHLCTVARSRVPNTRRSKAKPMRPMTVSAASMTSALRNSLASKITHPRPQSEAASISAPTTAIHARRKAWRSPAMMKGEAPGMITFQNKASHCARRAQPQRIDGAHARPGVQQQRKRRRIEHDQNRHHVAEAEPQDEDRHPSERGYGHQRAGERKKETFDRPNAAHEEPERRQTPSGTWPAPRTGLVHRGGHQQRKARPIGRARAIRRRSHVIIPQRTT